VLPKVGLKKLTASSWHAETDPLAFRQLEKSRQKMEEFFRAVVGLAQELEAIDEHWRSFQNRTAASDRDRPHQSPSQRHAQVMQQYFTSEANAAALLEWLQSLLPSALWANAWFVEPSAGAGDIYSHLPPGRRVGVELDADLCRRAYELHGYEFQQGDYLTGTKASLGFATVPREAIVVVGNPPYVARDAESRVVEGRELLFSFVYHSLSLGGHVALVMPKQAQGEAFQTQARPGWAEYRASHRVEGGVEVDSRLEVITAPAPDDRFSFCGKSIRRKSTFQLWRLVPVLPG